MEFRQVQIFLLNVHVPRSKENFKVAISRRRIKMCKK